MSAARWSVALGCAGLLVAACTQQVGPPVIGALPQPSASPAPPIVFDTSAIEAGLSAQLAASTNVSVIQQGPLAPGEIPIDTFLTFKEQLRWANFETIALAHIDKDLAALALVRYRVVSDGHIAGWQVGTITSSLDTATFELTQLRATIAADQLVYQARGDLNKFYRLRIGTRVLTASREMLSAYDLGGLAAIYATEMAPMPQEILKYTSCGLNVTTANAYFTDLSAQIGAMSYDSSRILAYAQSGLYKSAHGFQQAGLAANSAAQSDVGGARAAFAVLRAQGAAQVPPCT